MTMYMMHAARTLASWPVSDLAAEAVTLDDAIVHCAEHDPDRVDLIRSQRRVLDALADRMGLGPFDVISPELLVEVAR